MTDPTNPNDPPAKPGGLQESLIEREEDALADHLAGSHTAAAAGGLIESVVAPHFQKEMGNLLQDLDAEAAADKRMLAEMPAALHDHGPLELPGADLAALKAADPQFDDENFMIIARETFYKVREARSLDNPAESEAMLSPAMQADLQNAIAGDVASHRHHLLPALEISRAQIASAEVKDGKHDITVRFLLSGEELDRDASGKVISGDTTVHQWSEDWHFERDPAIDTSESDERHILSYEGWMVAHRGWIVTAIDRLAA